jgi:predicted SAM-dependent methyltransferase
MATLLEPLLANKRRAGRFVRYAGNRYECPICSRHFRRFADFRDRENVACPGCFSLERHRSFWLFLEREVLRPEMRVLHVAPEPGIQGHLRRMFPNYLSIDLQSPLADQLADVTDLPFEDGSFDLVICSHVLEHVPDDRKAMRELHRVLVPGGLALMQHPIDHDRAETYEDWTITEPDARAVAFNQWDHVRIYGRDMTDRLVEAGFEVTPRRYEDELGDELIDRYRLFPDELLLARVPA